MIYPTHHHKPDLLTVLMLCVAIGLAVTVAVQFNTESSVESTTHHVVVSTSSPVLAQNIEMFGFISPGKEKPD